MTSQGDTKRGSTRERILEIALELFVAKGYDATSLRDIAERLGTTKAALYYHFARKEDIFLELHLRLHALGRELLESVDGLEGPAIVAAWPGVVDRFAGLLADNRELFLLHERNPHVLEGYDNSRNAAEHEALETALRRTLTHEGIRPAQRLRMICALAAVAGGVIGGGNLMEDLEPDELVDQVRAIVADLTAPMTGS